MAVPAWAQAPPVTAPAFADFFRTVPYTFTGGLFAPDQALPAVIGAGASAALVPLDREISDAVRGDAPWVGDSGDVAGGTLAVASIAGLVVAGPLASNTRYRAFAFSLGQAAIVDTVLVSTIKVAVGRERPDGSNHRSFPSGHASTVIMLAGVASHYYGWKAGVPLYALSAFVAVSRVEKGQHFPSDVVFGATLGYLSARAGVHGAERTAARRWTIVPSAGPSGAALFVVVH
jgi:membrane-associated phospholipid phosphatase